jgi:hypothetical protein
MFCSVKTYDYATRGIDVETHGRLTKLAVDYGWNWRDLQATPDDCDIYLDTEVRTHTTGRSRPADHVVSPDRMAYLIRRYHNLR